MNPLAMLAGIGILLLHGNKRKKLEQEANDKMDTFIEYHKRMLREGHLLEFESYEYIREILDSK